MRKIKHALSGSMYEWADDSVGPVRVTRPDGTEGRFDRNGRWVNGDVRHADPELCRWVFSGGSGQGDLLGASRRYRQEDGS